MKVVMILNSNGSDRYLTMHKLAVRSLRLTNPDLSLVTCIDEGTLAAVGAKTKTGYVLGDEILTIKTPQGSGTFKNRWIKTQLRHFISGEFLYLDSDVLILDDIRSPFDLDGGLAAVRNTNGYALSPTKVDEQKFTACNWRIPKFTPFNAGVWYLADTDVAQEFSRCYHAFWAESAQQHGLVQDQHAFNRAIDVSGIPVCYLPDEYNIQEKYFVFHKNPKIWHFINSNAGVKSTVWSDAIENKAPIDIRNLISANHPYQADNIAKKILFWIVSRRRNRRMPMMLRLFLHGKKLMAVKQAILEINKILRIEK